MTPQTLPSLFWDIPIRPRPKKTSAFGNGGAKFEKTIKKTSAFGNGAAEFDKTWKI